MRKTNPVDEDISQLKGKLQLPPQKCPNDKSASFEFENHLIVSDSCQSLRCGEIMSSFGFNTNENPTWSYVLEQQFNT